MALLNAPSTVFASPQPACRIPPRRHLLIGAVGPQKPDTDTLQGKAVCHPIRYGCFLHGAIPFDRATAVQPPAQPYGFARFAYPRATRPPRHVPRQRMGGGTAGFDVFRGGLGRVGNDGREGGPLPPLRRPVEGAQGLEQAMTRHAGGGVRQGGRLPPYPCEKASPQSSRVLSRRDA